MGSVQSDRRQLVDAIIYIAPPTCKSSMEDRKWKKKKKMTMMMMIVRQIHCVGSLALAAKLHSQMEID